MNSRDEAIRRVAFWAAMLTGVALVGMQFGCSQPQTVLSAPGFPRASRRIESQPKTTLDAKVPVEEAKEVEASLYWTSPRPVVTPSSRALSQNDQPEWSRGTGMVEPSRPATHAAGGPPFTSDDEPAK